MHRASSWFGIILTGFGKQEQSCSSSVAGPTSFLEGKKGEEKEVEAGAATETARSAVLWIWPSSSSFKGMFIGSASEKHVVATLELGSF